MKRLDFNTRNMSVQEKIRRGRTVLQAMTENPNFHDSAAAATASLTAATDELESAYMDLLAARSAVQVHLARVATAEKTWQMNFHMTAYQADIPSGGDDATNRNVGFSSRGTVRRSTDCPRR